MSLPSGIWKQGRGEGGEWSQGVAQSWLCFLGDPGLTPSLPVPQFLCLYNKGLILDLQLP